MREPFTLFELSCLRRNLESRLKVWVIADRMRPRTRDEVVEAIDALRRHPHKVDALQHVNTVLDYQNRGIPLVNGRPARSFRAGGAFWRPMF